MGLLEEIARSVLDLVYPPRCCVCDAVGEGYLCCECVAAIQPVAEPRCPICGEPDSEGLCFWCERQRPAYERARSIGMYEGVLREAIHALKYERRSVVARPLGELMGRYAAEDPHLSSVDLVVPVPIHERRERWRGFNQSALLAAAIGDAASLKPLYGVLLRVAERRQQVGLDRAARKANVEGAFVVARASDVAGRQVLLVDDVMTTGATCNAAAEALIAAGAAGVQVLTLAREP